MTETTGRPEDAPISDWEVREANTTLLLAALQADQDSADAEVVRSQLHLLFEGLSEGVLVVDPDRRIQFINSVAEGFLSLSRDEPDTRSTERHRIVQRLDGSAIDPEEWPIARAARGQQFTDEVFELMVSGQARQVSFSANCIRAEDDAVLLAVLTCRDITELRRLERVRQEYTELISHDLRNPLTVILAASQRLSRQALTGLPIEDAAELGELITRNARRIQEMAEELVEAAYFESGRAELSGEPVSLHPLVSTVVERLGQSDRIHVKTTGQPVPINGDRTRLERLVANLVGNALKYSLPGTPIDVGVDSRPHEVVVSVRDQGKGILASELPYLFDRFYRVRRASAAEGSGLGLYIASMVTRAHRGWIKAESEVGVGSVFSFGLPTMDLNALELD